MRQDHPELLTTLRDVAATAVTFLAAFAQIRRERMAPPAASSPIPQADPDHPTDAPAPQADLDGAPDPCPTAAPADPPDTFHPIFLTTFHQVPEMTPTDTVIQRIVETSGRSIAREQQLLQQRMAAREFTTSINQRLCEIAELASAAIEGDGVQTLPILDVLLERLHNELRDQTGPFAAAPDIELVR